MTKLQLALNLIRAPWLQRLMDRTFITTVGTALTSLVGVVAIWRTPGVPVNDKIQSTIVAWLSVSAVVAFWNHSEKSKDKAIALAAMAAPGPQDTPLAAGLAPLGTPPAQALLPLTPASFGGSIDTSTQTSSPLSVITDPTGDDDNDGHGPQDEQ